jgi:hypothetical protein
VITAFDDIKYNSEMRQAVVRNKQIVSLVKGLQPVVRGNWNIHNRDNRRVNVNGCSTLLRQRKCQLWPGEQEIENKNLKFVAIVRQPGLCFYDR